MKRLLLIFILTLSFQTLTKADDIRDFQIEGMSIGDSVLDYVSKDEIKVGENNPTFMRNKDGATRFIIIFLKSLPKKNYEKIQVTYKYKDKEYIIHSIDGVTKFVDDFEGCKKKKKIIVKDLKEIFKDAKLNEVEKKHEADKSGKSTHSSSYLNLNSGQVQVWCTNWSSEVQWTNSLMVSLNSKEYRDFLINEAYK